MTTLNIQNASCDDDFLDTPKITAAMLGVSEGTLAVWRCTGRYDLPFVKIGSKVRYRRSDTKAFIARRTMTRTA